MEDYNTLYQKLNAAQKEAVDYIDGPLMIVAGAGTGKTQVLAMRIANILQQTQLNPQNILCLTFTEAGVSAMRDRLFKIIGAAAYGVRVYTFHSFCNEVISTHPEKFPELGKDALALKEIDKLQILDKIINALVDSPLKPFGRPDTYLYEIARKISGLKNENISPEKFGESIAASQKFSKDLESEFTNLFELNWRKLTNETFSQLQESLSQKYPQAAFSKYLDNLITIKLEDGSKLSALRKDIKDLYQKYFGKESLAKNLDLQKVYQLYQQELRKQARYDFEDMIMLVVDRLGSDNELLSEYQEQYQYILVDEYQDTNSAQNQAVSLLGSFFENPNICVVGDDDQAIYRFQGASIENMLFFHEKYQENIKLITLTDNYRSHQIILDAAKSLIENNQFRIGSTLPQIDKNLKAGKETDIRPIEVHEFPSATQQYSFVANQIKELIKTGIEPQEIAILFRENKEAHEIADNLNQYGVDYVLEKGESVLKNQLLSQLLLLLQYLVNPNDQSQLYKVLNLPFLQIPILDLVKANHYAYFNKQTLFNVIADPQKLKAAEVKDVSLFADVVTKLVGWQQQVQTSNATVFFTNFIRESGYLNYLLAQPHKYQLLSLLQKLYSELKELTISRRNYTLVDFIHELQLYEDYKVELIDKFSSIGENKVRLMTAHGAKGLEFAYVFVVNCLDKKWGNNSSHDKIKLPIGLLQNQALLSDNDEERRLFYVALTRAKKHAIISYPKYNPEGRALEPSVFINADIDKQYLKLELHEKDNTVLERFWDGSEILARDFSSEGKAYLKTHLANINFSVTDLNSYLKCPRCYYVQKVLRIPELKTPSLALGTAMHEAMRFWIQTLKETNSDPTLAQLNERVRVSLRHEIMNEQEIQVVLDQAKTILKEYYEQHVGKLNAKAETEFNLGKYHIHLDDTIPITGKIDRIDLLGGNLVKVVDYKTGNPDTKAKALNNKEIGDYFRQLVFYKILIESVAGLGWQVNEGAIEFLEISKKKKMFTDRIYTLEAEQVETVKQQIRDVFAKILNLEFDTIGEDCENDELHALPYLI